MKLFHDGKADSRHGVEITFNNWFVLFVWKASKDDKGLQTIRHRTLQPFPCVRTRKT